MEEANLIKKEDHYLNRKVKEAIGIEKMKNNLNQDDGFKPRNVWKPLL